MWYMPGEQQRGQPDELQAAWDARGSMTAQGLSMVGLTLRPQVDGEGAGNRIKSGISRHS